mmetsp:Transcript_19180/g.39680  ORF Transcript_19180/g.39680 Transcript_19180/m.39680 type:complete len:122 (-) Transcript_19180:50-415(-)
MEFWKPSFAYNPLLLHLSCGGLASQNHCFWTPLATNTITQQQSGIWSPNKLQQFNNTHGEVPAKYRYNCSCPTFVLIFSAQDNRVLTHFAASFDPQDSPQQRDATTTNTTNQSTPTSNLQY